MIVVAAHFAFCHLESSPFRRSLHCLCPLGLLGKTHPRSAPLSRITTTARAFTKLIGTGRFHAKAQRPDATPQRIVRNFAALRPVFAPLRETVFFRLRGKKVKRIVSAQRSRSSHHFREIRREKRVNAYEVC